MGVKLLKTETHVKELTKEWFEARKAWSYAPIQNGLGEHGIHDRVGCVPVVVTEHMVGMTVGLFVSLECKAPGRRGEKDRGLSTHQRIKMDAINEAHGISDVVDGREDLSAVDGQLDWMLHGAR
jgi:hypothetical protein